MNQKYSENEPSRAEVDAIEGLAVIEFGTNWCGICAAAQPAISAAFAAYPHIRHLKVSDGPGQPLGRSFKVKLWPTLIFMKRGREVDRLVRPQDREPISAALDRLVR